MQNGVETAQIESWKRYCNSLIAPSRLRTREVKIGGVGFGGDNPIRIQSMTTTNTRDTAATVEQSIRMIEAGCELVRITAPSLKDAENLKPIREQIRARGYTTPLVADIHYTPKAAEVAAYHVEKVRVNPGNYADKKKFEFKEYTDADYQAELQRIYERFAPLVKICKAQGTAMRIGTNHGSLSDRIMSYYGDTPTGMVESALEFVDICEDLNFHDIIISMKASNPQVMVQAYRLLVHRMLQRDHVYPLHLGVTEAGEGEDGRIKSALGVGALLEDGLGDTIRVSLTEAPEAEMPVGYYLRDHFYAGPTTLKSEQQPLDGLQAVPNPVDPYDFKRRNARKVFNTGGADNTPRVIGDLSHKQPLAEKDLMAIGHYFSLQLDKWNMTELGADFVYLGQQPAPFMLPNGLKAIYDAALWQQQDAQGRENAFPYFASLAAFEQAAEQSATLNFVRLQPDALAQPRLAALAEQPVVLILESEGEAQEPILRHMIHQLLHWGVDLPVLVRVNVQPEEQENGDRADHRFQLTAAATLSGLVVDGLIDGVWLTSPEPDRFPTELQNRTAFGILQAGRLRITRTEYISCPSCGRTLFDLEETTARIRARTDHLKGVKIGIMGCIVNGPGEMADADYGYVGSGPGKITLYRGKEVVRRNVPTEDAVDALIELIDEDGNWIERGGDN